jgi:general stress protein 26
MNDHQKRAWQMMSDLDFCMFVTHPGSELRGRPMSSIVKQDEGRIYFLSDTRSATDEEISRNSQVLLCYGGGQGPYISTSVSVTISSDRALIKRLWNPGAQAFWPDGSDDPNVIAIVATPTGAEYWDGSGGVINSVKFAFALLTGSTPDMGVNAKVVL